MNDILTKLNKIKGKQKLEEERQSYEETLERFKEEYKELKDRLENKDISDTYKKIKIEYDQNKSKSKIFKKNIKYFENKIKDKQNELNIIISDYNDFYNKYKELMKSIGDSSYVTQFLSYLENLYGKKDGGYEFITINEKYLGIKKWYYNPN